MRHDSGVLPGDSEKAGAPANDEVEITSEMIDAGEYHLYSFSREDGNEREVVKSIFKAMYQIMSAG